MAIESRKYWQTYNGVHKENEWYFDLNQVFDLVKESFQSCPAYPIVMHGGCGSSNMCRSINDYFENISCCLNVDFIMSEINIQRNACDPDSKSDFAQFDLKRIPVVDDYVDIIVEKGLFDSVTANHKLQSSNSNMLLNEYYRVLSKNNGVAFIFSIFGPNGEQKDMFGLLCHQNFTVQLVNIPISPLELPSEYFCYLYILRIKRQ